METLDDRLELPVASCLTQAGDTEKTAGTWARKFTVPSSASSVSTTPGGRRRVHQLVLQKLLLVVGRLKRILKFMSSFELFILVGIVRGWGGPGLEYPFHTSGDPGSNPR